MSIINKITVSTHCNDLGGKLWNPAIKWTKKYAVFIELEDDQGAIGLGECWCFDASPETLLSFLRTELAEHILGVKTDALPAVMSTLWVRATLTARHGILASALSGIDIALWDMQSKKAGQPLWKYLQTQGLHSTTPEGCVYLYGSGGLYGENKSTEDLVSEMQGICAKGFDTVKMKIGALSIEDDVARVKAVAAGLDKKCHLIVDGVGSYSVDEALLVFKALHAQEPIAFQSPINVSDTRGMRALLDAGAPVMASESEYRHEVHKELTGCVKFLQTAPIACGGISRLIELTKLDASTALSLEVSSTAIALLAACHFAAASDAVAHTEYHFVHQVFFDDLSLSPIRGNPGWFQLPLRPGLGIDLPREQLDTGFTHTV